MQAVGAIKAIRHTARNQIDWFSLRGDIFRVRQPVWIIRQEQFESDVAVLLKRCGIEPMQGLFDRQDKLHATDYRAIPPISPEGERNLRSWFSQDFAFYDACQTWMDMQPDDGHESPRLLECLR